MLNPKTYVSLSGEFQLDVDPSAMHGQGAGIYRLTRRGKKVWTAKHPFTLWEAGVTDDGVVAGYAYTHGWRGYPTKEARRDWNGHFHVVIFGPDGKLRLNDVIKRKESRALHTPPNPLARGMFIDQDKNRLVVRVADPGVNQGIGIWWVYDLASGKRLDDIQPNKHLTGAGRTWHAFDVRPVRGTPLSLIHGWVWGDKPGGKFVLVDHEGRPVWVHDVPGDYDIGVDRQAEWQLRDYLREHGAILSCKETRRFELWHVTDKERVTFEVRASPDGRGAWEVAEVQRKAHVGAEVANRLEPEFETLELKRLGTITLGEDSSRKPAIRNVRGFDFDAQGHIGFTRSDADGSCTFVLVKPDGEVLNEIPVREAGDSKRTRFSIAWVRDARWLVVGTGWGVSPPDLAWWIETNEARVQQIEPFECPPRVEQVVGDHRGGFVALTEGEFTQDGVISFDRNGKRRWRVGRKHSGRDTIMFPDGIAVTSGGQIAVISPFTKLVQLFDGNGKYVRTIDLRKSFGREPTYPTGVSADVNGGLVIGDFQASPPIWRIRADGGVVSKFQPKHEDGRTFPIHYGIKVAPDGRLWTCDGTSLLRLTDRGVVDLVLGESPDAARLGESVAMAIDHRGRFYVVSKRTGAVHIFDKDGNNLHIRQPLPTDLPNNMMDAEITVAGDGSVYIKEGGPLKRGGYLQFGADGRRVGVEKLADDSVTGEWHFKPASQERWVVGWQELHLVGEDGNLIRTIKRRPNRDWLETVHGIGIAPDGGAAIGSRDSRRSAFTKQAINLYGPKGEPIRTIPLPFDGYIFRIAYNGKFIVLSRQADLLILDAGGKAIRRFAPTESQRDKPYWQPFFSPDGAELWLCEQGSRTVHRYQAPQLGSVAAKSP